MYSQLQFMNILLLKISNCPPTPIYAVNEGSPPFDDLHHPSYSTVPFWQFLLEPWLIFFLSCFSEILSSLLFLSFSGYYI